MNSTDGNGQVQCRTISQTSHLRLLDLAEDKIVGIDTWLYEVNDLLRTVENIPSDALVSVLLQLDSIGQQIQSVRKDFISLKAANVSAL